MLFATWNNTNPLWSKSWQKSITIWPRRQQYIKKPLPGTSKHSNHPALFIFSPRCSFTAEQPGAVHPSWVVYYNFSSPSDFLTFRVLLSCHEGENSLSIVIGLLLAWGSRVFPIVSQFIYAPQVTNGVTIKKKKKISYNFQVTLKVLKHSKFLGKGNSERSS